GAPGVGVRVGAQRQAVAHGGFPALGESAAAQAACVVEGVLGSGIPATDVCGGHRPSLGKTGTTGELYQAMWTTVVDARVRAWVVRTGRRVLPRVRLSVFPYRGSPARAVAQVCCCGGGVIPRGGRCPSVRVHPPGPPSCTGRGGQGRPRGVARCCPATPFPNLPDRLRPPRRRGVPRSPLRCSRGSGTHRCRSHWHPVSRTPRCVPPPEAPALCRSRQ